MVIRHSFGPYLRLAFCAVMVSLVCPAFAKDGYDQQQKLKQLTLEQLGKIEVTTVSKEPAEVWNTPAAIYVITQADIRRSGFHTLPNILRLAPGVEVAQIDGNKWAIGIRGFEGRLSKSVLVLIDGRSVYTPLFAGVYWEAQDAFIQDIERIEVIRGPGGTIWGSNAVNGVINIITKHSRDTQGLLFSAGGGNVEQGFADLRYGGSNGPFTYRMYGKWFTNGPEHHSDNVNFDDWRHEQFGFRTDWAPNNKDEVTFQGDIYHSTVGQRLMLSYYDPPSIVDTPGNVILGGGNLLARWRRVFSENSDLQIHTYYDRTHRADLNYEEIRHTFDLDLVHHIGWNRNNFIWGAGVRVSPSDYIQTLPTVDFLPHDQQYNLFTGFVQDEFALVPERLKIIFGMKMEHNSFSGFEFQPSGRILWTPTPMQTVWAAVTRAVRSPSRIEDSFRFDYLAAPAVPLYIRLIGDGQFVSEKMLGYELGYRTMVGRKAYIDLAGFYNQYDDLESVENLPPVVETSPGPPHLILPIYLRNGLKGETAGYEISPTLDLTSFWRLKGSYSYLYIDTRRKPWSDDASSVKQTEGDSPHHKIYLQSTFELPKGFALDLAYRFTSSIPDQKIRAYSTGDARFSWQVNKNLNLAVAGLNLFQPYHFEYGGDPGPLVGIRRSIRASITITK